MSEENKACMMTPQDSCNAALAHYERLSDQACHYMNCIPPAIHFWFMERPILERELAALTAELAEYERTVAHMRDGARLQDSATAAVMERNEKLTARVAELERDAEKRQDLRLEKKPCGDVWLHVTAQNGSKASLNLGLRGGWLDKSFIGRTIAEVAYKTGAEDA